jgi:L-threonylcarbamoyladenylate synthase
MDFVTLVSLEELTTDFDYLNWLKQGGIIGLPTETVYGLAAMASQPAGIEKIYAIKKRPHYNPLIIHYPCLEEVYKDAVFSSWALQLAKTFWPGPLTLLLPKKENSSICPQAHSFLPSIAARIPDHPVARGLLEKTGPLAAPSANLSGCLSPTSPEHVLHFFRGQFPVLDGGPCKIGLESTIIDACQASLRILRPGTLTLEKILEQLPGVPLEAAFNSQGQVVTPGSMLSHYAPQKPIRCDVQTLEEGEGLIAFGPPLTQAEVFIQLSWARDLDQAAHNFFAALHAMDKMKTCKKIAVMPIPHQGIGIAINDRLKRACYK